MTQTPPDYTFEIRMENFLPVLQTQLEGKTLDLALDSGAAVNIVDQQFKEHLMSKAAQVRSMQLGGAFSEVKTVEVCTYTHIVLDKQLAVKWWRAAFNDLSHLVRENIKIGGIIGVGFFQ